MSQLWKYISFLGIEKCDESLECRTKKLCNQINVIILLITFFLVVFLRIMGHIENAPMGIGSFRVLFVFAISLINLVLSANGFHYTAKISTIFFPSFLFLVVPTLMGFVEPESFTYYAFVAVSLSITPQLLLLPDKDKILYWFSLGYFFVLVFLIDLLLFRFMPQNFSIAQNIKGFYPYYKAAHISIFVFVNLSVLYLRKINVQFEETMQALNAELIDKNEDLNRNKKELEHSNVDLQTSQAELKIRNSELEETLDNLKQTQQKLVQSEKMASLGILTAGVGHEINNPLNFIVGGVGVIDVELENIEEKPIEKLNSSDVSTLISVVNNAKGMISSGADKISKIVNALKVYSYNGDSVLEKVDVNEIIESSLMFMYAKLDSDITLIKSYNLEERVSVFQDKMHQVFLNLFDNAIYATKQSDNIREIVISTSSERINNSKFCLINIKNSGPNIPDEVLKNIFNPFYSTKKPGEGTGLGLSITYDIIQKHKGEIEIVNLPDGVSCLIRLPL